jgi:hypothetical protein
LLPSVCFVKSELLVAYSRQTGYGNHIYRTQILLSWCHFACSGSSH